jgi:ribosomal protein S18 acetylase RimI-like enzyme
MASMARGRRWWGRRKTKIIREFRFPADYTATVELWDRSGPGVHVGRSDTLQEIAKKLQRDPDLFLVAEAGGKLIGTVIGGYDGRRGLVYHLAVDKTCREQGIGTALMDELERRLKTKGCLKTYLLVVPGNEEAALFYERRGWQRMDVAIYGKELQ